MLGMITGLQGKGVGMTTDDEAKRNKEIVCVAKNHETQTGFCDLVKSPLSKGVNSAYGLGFIEGAVWADNKPSQQALAKELYRLGYTITLNGDIIPRAEEEKAMKSYIEYQKSQVIDKACEWLEENINKYLYINTDWNTPQLDYEFLKKFKKAMEGGDE